MHIRTAQEKDLPAVLQILNDQLADTSGLSINRAKAILNDNIKNQYFVVAVEGDQVVGTGSILIEGKFIHNGGFVGHLEDICIDKNYCGKGVGREIINKLVEYAKLYDCYKIILECSNKNVPFYKKCGFREHGVTMRMDLEE